MAPIWSWYVGIVYGCSSNAQTVTDNMEQIYSFLTHIQNVFQKKMFLLLTILKLKEK